MNKHDIADLTIYEAYRVLVEGEFQILRSPITEYLTATVCPEFPEAPVRFFFSSQLVLKYGNSKLKTLAAEGVNGALLDTFKF